MKYCVQLMTGSYLEVLSLKQRSAWPVTADSNWDKILKYVNIFAFNQMSQMMSIVIRSYRGADKSLAWPATATEDFEFHISYL